MGYSHQNSKGKTYFLHSKDVVLKGGRNQTIYYFAKEAKAEKPEANDDRQTGTCMNSKRYFTSRLMRNRESGKR